MMMILGGILWRPGRPAVDCCCGAADAPVPRPGEVQAASRPAAAIRLAAASGRRIGRGVRMAQTLCSTAGCPAMAGHGFSWDHLKEAWESPGAAKVLFSRLAP